MRKHPVTADRTSIVGRVAIEGKSTHIADVGSDPELTLLQSPGVARVRTALGVPMLREGKARRRSGVDKDQARAVHRQADRAGRDLRAIENVRPSPGDEAGREVRCNIAKVAKLSHYRGTRLRERSRKFGEMARPVAFLPSHNHW
jgi:hypothetical protein